MAIVKIRGREFDKRGIREKRTLSGHSELIYTREFGEFVGKKRGVLRDFLNARKQILEGTKSVRIGNIVFEKFSVDLSDPHSGNVHSVLYKVSDGTRILFVKEQNPAIFNKRAPDASDFGPAQVYALMIAKPIIESLGCEVINFYFARRFEKISFFVSDFYDLNTVSFLRRSIIFKLKKYYRLKRKIKEVELALKKVGVGHVGINSCFYDKKTDKLIFFDLRLMQ